ncbi:flagellar biosynthetic protein FliO [Janthinobacterium aquaticum]|nr:flagellar biosynthetic protein FliO [Janthinobacterium sp. FT58W]
MAPTASTGSLLQTIAALVFVLALLMALAWAMKRYGPKAMGNSNKMRVISSLNLGGRERIVLIEVADQWIVVGASPGRINALATVPRQDADLAPLPASQNGPAGANFSEWLKQTIEKRNGK